MENLIRSNYNDNVVLNVTPKSAGWNHLSFKVVALKSGQTFLEPTKNNEIWRKPTTAALTPLTALRCTTIIGSIRISSRFYPCVTATWL